MSCDAQLTRKYLIIRTFFKQQFSLVKNRLLACNQRSLVGLRMQDYKSMCAAVMISSTMVNIQTHTDNSHQLI